MTKIEIHCDEGGKVSYYFESTGSITPVRLNSHDDVGEKYVNGWCGNGGVDSFEYNGVSLNFIVQSGYENMTLLKDGKEKLPSHLKANVATVESVNGNLTAYGIGSSEKMIRTTKHGADINDTEERIDGSSWEGEVIGGKDAYAFQGGLEHFWCNQDCYLTVNGVRKRVKGNAPEGDGSP